MSDAPLLEEIQDELRTLGFEFSSLGGGSYSVQGIPAGVEGIEPRQLLTDIIETLKEGGQKMEDELHHRMALAMAQDAAIPVGNVLTQQEMENLVDELFQQSEPNYAPDGKTIVTILPHETLEKLFR